MIVLAGRTGHPVAALGHDQQRSQAQDEQGRDPCRAHAAQAFAVHAHGQRDAHLVREHGRKAFVGELTGALNTSAARLG
jgi:hypothetical protein